MQALTRIPEPEKTSRPERFKTKEEQRRKGEVQ
jgi:hypothetical protein